MDLGHAHRSTPTLPRNQRRVGKLHRRRWRARRRCDLQAVRVGVGVLADYRVEQFGHGDHPGFLSCQLRDGPRPDGNTGRHSCDGYAITRGQASDQASRCARSTLVPGRQVLHKARPRAARSCASQSEASTPILGNDPVEVRASTLTDHAVTASHPYATPSIGPDAHHLAGLNLRRLPRAAPLPARRSLSSRTLSRSSGRRRAPPARAAAAEEQAPAGLAGGSQGRGPGVAHVHSLVNARARDAPQA